LVETFGDFQISAFHLYDFRLIEKVG